MLKRELFLAAMRSGLYKNVAWIITAFSITREGPDDWKKDPYPYRIVFTPTGTFCVDPSNTDNLLKVEDAPVGQALYRFKEKVLLGHLDVPNLWLEDEGTQIVSGYGNVLFNWVSVVDPFQGKIPYYNPKDKVKVGYLADQILPRLQDDPKPGDPVPKAALQVAPIYISEYLRWTKSMFFHTSLTQLCTYGATKKVLLPPDGIQEFKAKLLEDNKDMLHDKAVIAKIDKALVDFDAAYLKGDPAENFLIDDKSRSTVRRKLFLMLGAESGLDENTVKATLIQNSLLEGWDVTKFAEMNNASRAGSFNRGSQTQLGGVSVKWLLRASSNMNMTVIDCGTRMGNVTLVTPDALKSLVGFSMVTQEGHKLIKTKEEAGAYLGKKLMMRSPMYCALPQTDFCHVCCGTRLSVNPDGLSIAVSDYGSTFLSIYMKAMHGKNLQLAKMNIATAIF